MKPEIRQYLEANAPTYTPEAMRRALLEAGHDEAEVDAALREWHIERSGGISDEDRRAYRLWSAGIFVGALLVVALVAFVMSGPDGAPIVLIGAGVLAVFLLLGWAVSSVIAAILLPRTSLAIALIVPAVLAIGLGGTCLALVDGMTPTPPLMGSMQVQIGEPLAVEATGTAFCARDLEPGSFSAGSDNLGTIGDRFLTVHVDRFEGHGDPNAPAPPEGGDQFVALYIALNPRSEFGQPSAWTNTPETELEIDVSEDGRSGTVTFDNLTPEPLGAPADEVLDQPISGTMTWTCEENGR